MEGQLSMVGGLPANVLTLRNQVFRIGKASALEGRPAAFPVMHTHVHRWHNLLEVGAEENSCSILVCLCHSLSERCAPKSAGASAFELRIKALQCGHRKRGNNQIRTHQNYEIVRPLFAVTRGGKLLLVEGPQRAVISIV